MSADSEGGDLYCGVKSRPRMTQRAGIWWHVGFRSFQQKVFVVLLLAVLAGSVWFLSP